MRTLLIVAVIVIAAGVTLHLFGDSFVGWMAALHGGGPARH